jgi:hypothetical protein
MQSSTRRLMIRFREGGKDAVTQRVQKEHDEYLEAFRQERHARDQLEMLVGERNEREIAVRALDCCVGSSLNFLDQGVDLANKEKVIEECKAKIDALYHGLFAGPTPGTTLTCRSLAVSHVRVYRIPRGRSSRASL